MSGFYAAQAAYEAPPGVGPDWIDCEDCQGTGQISDPDSGTGACEACNGVGQVDPQDSPNWCDRCGLTGRCPDCDPPDPNDRYDDDRDF